jgi:hypothetical protein
MSEKYDLARLAKDGLEVAESNAEFVRFARAWQDAHSAVKLAVQMRGTQAATLAERKAEDEMTRVRQMVQKMESEHCVIRERREANAR